MSIISIESNMKQYHLENKITLNAGESLKLDLEGEHPHCISAFTSRDERTNWLSSVLAIISTATTISCWPGANLIYGPPNFYNLKNISDVSTI